jgi:hypothetical protein
LDLESGSQTAGGLEYWRRSWFTFAFSFELPSALGFALGSGGDSQKFMYS